MLTFDVCGVQGEETDHVDPDVPMLTSSFTRQASFDTASLFVPPVEAPHQQPSSGDTTNANSTNTQRGVETGDKLCLKGHCIVNSHCTVSLSIVNHPNNVHINLRASHSTQPFSVVEVRCEQGDFQNVHIA